MQPINAKPLKVTTEEISTNNAKSNPVKVVNVDKKISSESAALPFTSENKISDKGCDIILGYLGEGNKAVYCCIGNLDNDQNNYEETLTMQIQAKQAKQERALASVEAEQSQSWW